MSAETEQGGSGQSATNGAIYRTVYETAPLAFVVWDTDCRITDWNRTAEKLFGWEKEEVLGRNFLDLIIPEEARPDIDTVVQAILKNEFENPVVNENRTKDGRLILCEWNNGVLRDEHGRINGAISLGLDISQRAEQEKSLRRSEEQFHMLFVAAIEGIVLHEMVYDELGRAVDYRILDVNPAFTRHTGMERETVAGGLASQIYGADEPPYLELYSGVAQTGEPAFFETYFPPLKKHFRISVFRPQKDQFATVFEDITERKTSEAKLAATLAELERSNEELQRFAYVAAHDLQEPLRKVTSFLQLLSRRYQGRLDSDADEFIQFAVGGAERMKALIEDLLFYSRVETQGKPLVEVDLNSLLGTIISDLEVTIQESQARLEVQDLPAIKGDQAQLYQLFQNLILNALKFKSDLTPIIRIRAEEKEGEWLFSVSDNGIGIDKRYQEKIFIIFQRLHGRADYPGTGIGLAVSKRIVERHGGRIWCDSRPGQGTVFYFTLPRLEVS